MTEEASHERTTTRRAPAGGTIVVAQCATLDARRTISPDRRVISDARPAMGATAVLDEPRLRRPTSTWRRSS